MRWFVRGDVDGFFGLALDNLVQLLLIDSLCRGVLGFDQALIYGRVLPAVAVSLLVGNLFYAWQAKRLATRTGRTDICALPYGINTVSLIAHVFLVMLPAKIAFESNPISGMTSQEFAWQAGLVACLGSGLIEFFGSFIAQWIRRYTPRAALLSTLSGIALGFISISFFFRTFAHPIVGLTTLGIILMTYFGVVRFRGGIPGGLVAVAVGTGLAWITGIAPVREVVLQEPSWFPPVWIFDDLWKGLQADHWLTYISVIIPMGLFNLLGSLQNIESAEAAGDSYSTAPSLAVNGIGTIAAACFGSCFPTTIYIGHPGWKAMGSRAGYSILNALFFTVICLTGLLSYIAWAIPVDAGMAIVLYIGIVITAQAFQVTPKEHAPAVVLGLLPGVAAWGTLMAKQALQVSKIDFDGKFVGAFHQRDNWIEGGFAISEGFILISMILSAMLVAIIEKKWFVAGIWSLIASGLATIGLIHSYRYTGVDTALAFGEPAWEWAGGYLIMGACLFLAPYITEPTEGH
jgi:adenine/guanine/hypoxanthine permease